MQEASLRVSDLGTAARLIRAGRLGLDLAASFVLAPVGLFALFIGLFSIVFLATAALASLLQAVGLGAAAAALPAPDGGGRTLSMAATAAALPLLVCLLAGVVSAARTPRLWALLALLPAAGFIMLMAAVAGEAATLTMSALSFLLTWGLGLLLALSVLLLFFGLSARRRTPVGRLVQDWPVFSIPIFAARFGFGRWDSWRSLLRIMAGLALKMSGLAVLFVGGIILSGALAFWSLRLLGLSPGGWEPLFSVMDVLAWSAVCVSSLLSARRSPASRIVDVPMALFAAFAAAELSLRYGDPSVGQAELEALNLVPTIWLFRTLVSRTVLGAWDELRQTTARTARELSEKRPEPPILFLRSFMDDEQTVPSSDASLAHAFGASNPTIRLEELVADIMFARGPLVALANPMVKTLPPGAARDVATDENWQEKVADYLEKSRIVVCFLGRTKSFQWEIDKILARSKLDSTLVVLPPTYPDDRQLVKDSPRLAALMGLRGEADERERLAGARVLVFDAQAGSFVAILSREADSFAYREAILLGAATLLCNRKQV